MRFAQVGKFQPLMGWHQAGPSHGAQPLSGQGLGHLLSASDSTRALVKGISGGTKAIVSCRDAPERAPSPSSPELGSVPAQLHVGSPRALVQPGLGHLQLGLFVPYGLLDDLDLRLDLEDFLPCLG